MNGTGVTVLPSLTFLGAFCDHLIASGTQATADDPHCLDALAGLNGANGDFVVRLPPLPLGLEPCSYGYRALRYEQCALEDLGYGTHSCRIVPGAECCRDSANAPAILNCAGLLIDVAVGEKNAAAVGVPCSPFESISCSEIG